MPFKKIISALLLLSFCPVFSQIYITNVSLGDVENQKIISNQTVQISGDRIIDIRASKKMKIVEGATVIDGTGKYLFPGMTDAHIHFFQSGGLYARPDAIDLRKEMPHHKELALAHASMETRLKRYLQVGITNVIDVGASYSFLKQKGDFKENNLLPSIYMTGPLLTTYEPSVYAGMGDESPFNLVQSIEDGINMVQAQLPHQPDFIKIWYITSRKPSEVEASARKNLPIIQAIIKEAHKHGLKVAVHATDRITAQLAVENGCDFLVHSVDNEVVDKDFVALLKEQKTILCPTLIVHSGYVNTFSQQLNINNYDLLKSDPVQLGSLMDLSHVSDTAIVNNYKRYSSSQAQQSQLKKADSISMLNLKILADAGVLIATGTDAGNIGTLHASSYLKELHAMKKSGLTNWQIMQASTINGAKVMGKEAEFGSIAIDKKANLILMDANPIDDISNITTIATVIINGQVLSTSEIIEETPVALAQRQLNAYNLRNIEAFLEPYAEDVEVYNYPNELRFKGKETMRKGYAKMFENTPDLHCELVDRIVQGNIVIDKELVQFGNKTLEAVAIYHIEDDKIKRVYFIQ